MDNSLTDLPVNAIKGLLHTRRVKGRDYYYLRYKILMTGSYPSTQSREIYVGPKDASGEELRYNYCHAMRKVLLHLSDVLYETDKRYVRECLADNELKRLTFLRLGYKMLKDFNVDDTRRYEEITYTKYVHGTTSIEGNTYTLRDTDLTLNEGLTVGGKKEREFYEIVNYRKLKAFLEPGKKIELDNALIKRIHSIIMENIDSDSAGHYRKVAVGIRGSVHEPPPHIFVEAEMDDLLKWYHENKKRRHPVEHAALFHQRFEEIHPFKDGNGRVGREIMRLMLAKNGYPTIFIGPQNREEYLKCLDSGNGGDHKPLCEFVVKNLLEVHKDIVKRAERDMEKSKSGTLCKNCHKKGACKALREKPGE